MIMGIGNKIRGLRLRRGFTQEELAAKIGVTAAAVGNYEHEVSFPKAEVLMRLFGALECSPNELLSSQIDVLSTQTRLSPAEYEHLNRYRALDEHGKKLVDACVETELERVLQEEIPIAARKGSSANNKLKKRNGGSVRDLPNYKERKHDPK